MDVLSRITVSLVEWAEQLSPKTLQFWLRLLGLLLFPVGCCVWTFTRGFRSVFVQVLAGVFGALVALSLPLEHLTIRSGWVRLWVLTFVLILLAGLPAVLPQFLLRTAGAQRRLRVTLYSTVGILVLVNLIWGS